MKTKITALIFIGSMMLLRADQLVEHVQQALKDQGFYYGEINGEMNANVTAAIRRYQIRNGLQNAPQDQQIYPSNPVTPGTSSGGGVLAGTPFEAAPPTVQRNVVLSAQIALARRGLFHEEINGLYGPAMEFSLRAYQSRTRLPVTGRLDLETLAALQLLPGARAPVFPPPRHGRPQPPIRGEWVPEY